ncbi:MAG: tyrosine-type recombinase/integrase [Steroidobacteraceae bacterium]
MIKFLFPRDWRRYVDGSRGMLINDFANWVVSRGYSRTCAKRHVRRLREVLTSTRIKIGPGEPISPAMLARCFAPWAGDSVYRGTHVAARRFLEAHCLLISRVERKPFDSLIATYRSYLIDQRGFSPSTVGHHLQTVGRFLESTRSREHSLARLSRGDVERFVDRTSGHLTRQSLQHTVAHLRSFLRFCSNRGLTGGGLDIIDTPRAYRGELPPRALPWSLVRKLLSSVDRSSIEGCRDHTILYLMAYYGLRPSEVASLTVDSISWDNRTLRVEQCKTRSVAIFPLDDRATRVLSRYLRCRPDGPWRELFLKIRCPAGPIKAATIGDIYDNRARRSGLPIVGSSSYSLRHSFAMRLLERGVGVKAIGDLLGHHSFESTCVYLRLHTDALRGVALPLPRRRHLAVEAAL